MKQILQNLSDGETSLVDVPAPIAIPGHILIQSTKSLLSPGTERMLLDFGKAGLIQKARSQPDKVKMVLQKARVDGVAATYEAVKSKLDQPIPLGYCNVGRVIDGTDTGFAAGDRVVSNGAHAEVVRIPKNLVAKIPDSVDDQSAAFTVLGAIALQGIRLANPTLGESVVVVGLGTIGLLAVQILKANGCRVLGVDIDPEKCEIARDLGAETVCLGAGDNLVSSASSFSRGRGVDAVLIAANSKSHDIVSEAAEISRKRGRIVLVGVVGLNIRRADFYEKELTFQVSCSYGPGRYEDEYEIGGQDYPLPYVRWTEQRNFEAVLDLMSTGAINVAPLISEKHSFDNALRAYENLSTSAALGVVLEYGDQDTTVLTSKTVKIAQPKTEANKGNAISFIGSGNYASRVLIPAFKTAGASFSTVVSSGGISAVHHGTKAGFENAASTMEAALTDNSNAVVIATRHNQHATQVELALKANKSVFVEKPLALTLDEIDSIEKTLSASEGKLMVGYNRRFAPLVQKAKTLLDAKTSPKSFIFTMNAGFIPRDHWTQDSEVGGGRIIGEACHHIDLMRFLAGDKIKSFHVIKANSASQADFTGDIAIITLEFENGSIGSLHYLSNGGKVFPKERLEVFCQDAVLQLDNFRKLTGFGWSGFKKISSWRQDKGQNECAKAFMTALENGTDSPIPLDQIFEVARISVEIANKIRT